MRRKLRIQLFFWVILGVLIFGISTNFYPYHYAILVSIDNLIFFAFVFYLNALFIFPKFYNSEKPGKFILLNILNMVALNTLFVITERYMFVNYAEVELPPHIEHPVAFRFIRTMFWMILIVTISTVYMIQDKLRKHQEISKKASEEKLNTELQLLKAQINPHFLFNALNNIYSLSYLKSDKAPEGILKLSAMLRYVIEDCRDETVTLKSEIQYIENYIAFQKMKAQDDINVLFNYKYINQNLKVSPLLLIPFIENSFKYSKIEEFPKSYINISIKTSGKNSVDFLIRNSIPPMVKAKPGAGTGIDNVKQRLKILYPGKHMLDIKETEKTFDVFLKLDLS